MSWLDSIMAFGCGENAFGCYTKLKKGEQTTKLKKGEQTTELKKGEQTTELKKGEQSVTVFECVEYQIGRLEVQILQLRTKKIIDYNV